MVPWLPDIWGAPTIRPTPFDEMKMEFKFGLPEIGGEGETWYQLIPFQCRIVAEFPTAQASCGFT
jgi:hypothetical protein